MFSRISLCLSLLLITFVGFSGIAEAHVEGVTDTSVEIRQSSVYVEYTIPTDELELLVNGSGNEAAEAVSSGVLLRNDNGLCALLTLRQQPIESIGSEQFLMNYDCGAEVENFSFDYQALEYLDESHENIVRFSLAGRVKYFLVNTEEPQFEVPVGLILDIWAGTASEIDSANTADAEDFQEGLFGAKYYFPVGLTHILMGYDHVLFLIALLLMPFRFKPLVALATSFTVAHSITLGLSVFNYVTLPVLLVEIAIAGSIVYVALENLWALRNTNRASDFCPPLYRRLGITFLFGLIHGFGFSYILKEMGLGDQALGALLFFNLGVEVGQLIVIALAFPLLYFIFKASRGILFARAGSVLVGCMGTFWLIERVLS